MNRARPSGRGVRETRNAKEEKNDRKRECLEYATTYAHRGGADLGGGHGVGGDHGADLKRVADRVAPVSREALANVRLALGVRGGRSGRIAGGAGLLGGGDVGTSGGLDISAAAATITSTAAGDGTTGRLGVEERKAQVVGL